MSDWITLTCPACGGKMNVADGAGRYICAYCGSEHLRAAPAAPTAAPPAARPLAPQPASVTVSHEGRAVRFERCWFSLKYVPLAFFCVAWDAFLLFWYGMAFQTGGPWILFVFPVVHLAIGVGLTYSTLAGFVNRTILEVDRESLAVWHTPLPWTNQPEIKTPEIAQLYCADKSHRRKNGGEYFTYDLIAVTRSGQAVRLLTSLDSPDLALYLEQQLERLLRIEDQPVAGELPR